MREQLVTIQTQVNAFAAPEVKARLARIDARRVESLLVSEAEARLATLVSDLSAIVPTRAASEEDSHAYINIPDSLGDLRPAFKRLTDDLRNIENALIDGVRRTINIANEAKDEWDGSYATSLWSADVAAAEKDMSAYVEELKGKGLSPDEFGKLQDKLRVTRDLIKTLEAKEKSVPDAKTRVANATEYLKKLYEERGKRRSAVLDAIRDRSGRLRFRTSTFSDTTRWQESVRSLCGFRVDAFQADVADLATRLWASDASTRDERWTKWRTALATGDFSKWQVENSVRPAFAQKLASLDESIRHRLATETPDDVVTMLFLRDSGNPENDLDWQPITEGSPGQRTAAMLAFVLHHGNEPLVLDQPEDDLDSEWISKLVVQELRDSRWRRQLIVVSHNANIPVLGDADQIITLENLGGTLSVRQSHSTATNTIVPHIGPVEYGFVRDDVQNIMEGGVTAFVQREQRYHSETNATKANSRSR